MLGAVAARYRHHSPAHPRGELRPRGGDAGTYRRGLGPLRRGDFLVPHQEELHQDLERFRLSGVPPGRYVVKAWIDSKTTKDFPVELKEDATLRVDFP